MIIEQIKVPTQEDLEWLEKAVVENSFGWTPSKVLEEYFKFNVTIWRINSPAKGVIVTEEHKCPKGRYMYISWMAGKKVFENIEEIREELEKYARKYKYFAILGEFKWAGFQKYYDVMGAVPDSQTYIYTLED